MVELKRTESPSQNGSNNKRYAFFLQNILSCLLVLNVLQCQILEELLEALFDTEICYLKDPSKLPFLAPMTLHAMRVTIYSTIGLTKNLLKREEFSFVLTGKFNQDCIEVRTSKILYV